jgi:hypothetical protein
MNFVDFNLSKKLKEKGFTCQYPIAMYNELGSFHALYTSADHNPNIESVFGNREYYDYDDFDDKDCVCPIISQVLKWLREEKKIYVSVEVEHEDWFEYKIVQLIKNTHCTSSHVYETYDDAMLAGIEYVLDNLI